MPLTRKIGIIKPPAINISCLGGISSSDSYYPIRHAIDRHVRRSSETAKKSNRSRAALRNDRQGVVDGFVEADGFNASARLKYCAKCTLKANSKSPTTQPNFPLRLSPPTGTAATAKRIDELAHVLRWLMVVARRAPPAIMGRQIRHRASRRHRGANSTEKAWPTCDPGCWVGDDIIAVQGPMSTNMLHSDRMQLTL